MSIEAYKRKRTNNKLPATSHYQEAYERKRTNNKLPATTHYREAYERKRTNNKQQAKAIVVRFPLIHFRWYASPDTLFRDTVIAVTHSTLGLGSLIVPIPICPTNQKRHDGERKPSRRHPRWECTRWLEQRSKPALPRQLPHCYSSQQEAWK